MNTIDHALRLLETEQAALGTGLAVVVVVAAVLVAFMRAFQGRIRWTGALVIISVGLLVGAGIVEASYYSWHRHRCVLHNSDIPECSARG